MFTKKMLSVTPSAYYLRVSKCPIENWELRFKEGYKAIRIYDTTDNKGRAINTETNKRIKGVRYNSELDYQAWEVLFKDFRDVIGLDEDFVNYIENIERLNDVMEAYIFSSVERQGIEIRDRKYLNKIKLLKSKIKQFEKSNFGKRKTITEVLVSLWKGEKLHIPKKGLTVEEYFALIKSYNKQT